MRTETSEALAIIKRHRVPIGICFGGTALGALLQTLGVNSMVLGFCLGAITLGLSISATPKVDADLALRLAWREAARLRDKLGQPVGTQYQEGGWDMAMRIATKLDALRMVINSDPVGFEAALCASEPKRLFTAGKCNSSHFVHDRAGDYYIGIEVRFKPDTEIRQLNEKRFGFPPDFDYFGNITRTIESDGKIWPVVFIASIDKEVCGPSLPVPPGEA